MSDATGSQVRPKPSSHERQTHSSRKYLNEALFLHGPSSSSAQSQPRQKCPLKHPVKIQWCRCPRQHAKPSQTCHPSSASKNSKDGKGLARRSSNHASTACSQTSARNASALQNTLKSAPLSSMSLQTPSPQAPLHLDKPRPRSTPRQGHRRQAAAPSRCPSASLQ